MEIGTMSAEELAQSFSNQTQNQTQEKVDTQNTQPVFGQQFRSFQENLVSNKSAEELAKEFETGVQKTDESKKEDTVKTPEELEAEKNAASEKDKGGRPPKTKLDDSFKQGLDKLFKEQKLSPYSDGTEDGYVVPETFEDVLELIEDNKKTWIENSKAKDRDELINEILSTKSPAWQFLIQNSEMYKDPAELVPLLTAVQNQEYSNSLDVTNPEDQEKIVRASLHIQGLPASAIEDEISDLKERGKLSNRSEALKPILDRYNEQQTEAVLLEKQQEEVKNQTFWNNHYQNLENTVFKSKDIDGVKLKNEHKQMIASALIPDDKIGGLPIYTIIDNLIAAGNFKVLSKIALLSQDEKSFDSYFLTKKADLKAEGVQKVLRQTGTNSNPTEFDDQNQKPKTIKKPSYGYFG